MKILKFLSVMILILILLDSFAYVNILTSEKYEIDLLETHYKVEGKSLPIESIEAQKIEIYKQKKRTKIELVILSTVFISLISILIYNNYKSKQ